MTSSKSKAPEHPVVVDARKLSMGLKTTFDGVSMIFDSLGIEAEFGIPEKRRGKAKKDEVAENQAKEGLQGETEDAAADGSGNGDTSTAADIDSLSDTDDSDEIEAQPDPVGTEEDSDPENTAEPVDADDTVSVEQIERVDNTDDKRKTKRTKKKPSEEKAEEDAQPTQKYALSPDDVTKIIVRKIKQDRSNNVKIGQILKTYGAAKVSDLDASKYEAFLTDIAEL